LIKREKSTVLKNDVRYVLNFLLKKNLNIEWAQPRRQPLVPWYEPIPQNFGIKNKVRWKKVIPKNIETLIENSYKDELLAYWYIDDGSGHRHGGVLNTQNFDSVSFNRLSTAVENIYGISFSSHCDRDYYRAYIQSDDVSNFVNRVKNTLLPCFHYKISEKYQYLLSKNEMD